MAQRYTQPIPRSLMATGLCPECGCTPDSHLDDNRFWIPRGCGLTRAGVVDRIAQYNLDSTVESEGS